MNNRERHIDLLDYLRGAAILFVLLYHTLYAVYGALELPWKDVYRAFPLHNTFIYFFPFSFGQIGVPIFFVISGFCIHLSFHQQGRNWRNFFIRRFFRIYPAYLAAFLFCALLVAVHEPPDVHNPVFWRVCLTHIFMVFNFDPASTMVINGSFWSLAIEAQLYLLYPALLFLVRRLGWSQTMALLGGCEFAIRFAYGLDGDCVPITFWFSWSLGAFIADAYLNGKPLFFTKVPVLPVLILMFASYFFKATIAFLFPLAAITTAILMSRLLNRGATQIQRPAMPWTVLKKIGVWSYSIYLLHQPLLMSYDISLTRIFPSALQFGPAAMCVMLLCWVPIICFAFLWFKGFEQPSISVGKILVEKLDGRMGSTTRSAAKSGGLKFALILVALIVFAVGNYFVESKLTHIDLATNPSREVAK